MNNFIKFAKMADENMDIRLAPLSNISAIDIRGRNGYITIGVPRGVAQALMHEEDYVGGLILANKRQFDDVVANIEKDELFAIVHKAYCKEYKRQKGKEYWTKGDYSLLDNDAKEFDRVTVKAVVESIFLSDGEKLRMPTVEDGTTFDEEDDQ